jgi:1,2-diacylglycerol 3-beta-glucosyltransferase
MHLFFEVVVSGIAFVVTGSVAYLLVLLCAATLARNAAQHTGEKKETASLRLSALDLCIAVVVPAHDEERVLAATLDSLRAQDYPGHLLEIVVVADNCTDSTAQIARDHGVTLLERCNAEERGKGYALDCAIERLLARSEAPDAVVVVDADTWVAPNFVGIMAAHLAAGRDASGCCVLQGRYGVLNRTEGWRATLMSGAFELVNHIRPLGYDRLGLSITLKGNGMAFTRAVLQRLRWQGQSLTEDMDYSLDLIRLHGLRVRYVPEALVLAQMPVTAGQAASQRARWEGGRYRLFRERALPLLTEGLRRRNLPLFDAGFALCVPPLAELAALLLLWGALIAAGSHWHLLLAVRWQVGLFALTLLGFLTYVLGGLRVAGASHEVYGALLRAPFYIVWKLALSLVGMWKRRATGSVGPPEWIRTSRTVPVQPPADEPPSEPVPQEKP